MTTRISCNQLIEVGKIFGRTLVTAGDYTGEVEYGKMVSLLEKGVEVDWWPTKPGLFRCKDLKPGMLVGCGDMGDMVITRMYEDQEPPKETDTNEPTLVLDCFEPTLEEPFVSSIPEDQKPKTVRYNKWYIRMADALNGREVLMMFDYVFDPKEMNLRNPDGTPVTPYPPRK